MDRKIQQFFQQFGQSYAHFLEEIVGIDDESDRSWYVSVVFTRLMLLYFLQLKGFVDGGNQHYLQNRLKECQKQGRYDFFEKVIKPLSFVNPVDAETPELLPLINRINTSLFLPHPTEERWPNVIIPNASFKELFTLFEHYLQTAHDLPIMLGKIFEMYVNENQFGAAYTCPEITAFLCKQTIHQFILQKMTDLSPAPTKQSVISRFKTIGEFLFNVDAPKCRTLLFEVLPQLNLLDPACGSGVYLVEGLSTLTRVYQFAMCRIPTLNDEELKKWLLQIDSNYSNRLVFIQREIICHNLFGVDLMPEAVEFARLRLLLEVIASAEVLSDVATLPSLDFNVMHGNSLIGTLRFQEEPSHLQPKLLNDLQKVESEIIPKIRRFRDASKDSNLNSSPSALKALREEIRHQQRRYRTDLNQALLNEFKSLHIRYEQATWNKSRATVGKPVRRDLTINDIESLQPFHWGFEFAEIMNNRGGFDVIISHPAWDIFRPQEAQFFADYVKSSILEKTTTQERKKLQDKLLRNEATRNRWLDYHSKFPHQIQYFLTQFRQSAGVLNLYRLFTEQSFNLVHSGGMCGLVLPSNLYTDLADTTLRKMLFEYTRITSLFGFVNRRRILANVHPELKFVLITFRNGGKTDSFPAAFLREDVEELLSFPDEGATHISADFITRLSPVTLSFGEFDQSLDLQIAEKMLEFPLLGEFLKDRWNLSLTHEFHRGRDKDLLKPSQALGGLPVYEGRMIEQFDHQNDRPRYWVDEKEGRSRLLEGASDDNQELVYQDYRLGIRAIGSRTLISTVLPPNVFCLDSILLNSQGFEKKTYMLACVALLNSFVVNWIMRHTTSAFKIRIDQLPLPRLTEKEPVFDSIVERAAKLICTSPEFYRLAQEAGLDSDNGGILDSSERIKLKAELDGIIAHLYKLTEEEFVHILSSFPLVEDEIEGMTIDAYRHFSPDPELLALIAGGETDMVEFKIGAYLNPVTNQRENSMRRQVAEAVAAFMNANKGGILLVGVADNGTVVGVEREYASADRGKANWDGYVLALSNMLIDTLSIENPFKLYQITPHIVDNKMVCRFKVFPSPRPVYIDKHFYVRSEKQSRELRGPDFLEYVRERWV